MESDINNHRVVKISEMYEDWFLDYASYVILERAIPNINDGLKPVQRRILHSVKELDDGRYNKVANIVGNTMKYHPHGDASITDAMVQLGQKELLIDTQGNWGNIHTGDRAAAARYIEARLTKFALKIAFNPKTTIWQNSYDGRNKEPINLPMKFPLLLMQGVEGIAVGLSTKIMSHNFNELIDASINNLKGKKVKIYPDFITGGLADFSNYNDGKRGGKVRLRAVVNKIDNKTLSITELPYGSTTNSIIDSILRANDKSKIRIKKIEDNTSSSVDIQIHLPAGISPDKMIDALYAFTDCEVSISPLSCVIEDKKPIFIGVSEILEKNTQYTKYLLKRELEISLDELNEQWHFSSLERIFIENKIYRKIENEETWEGVISSVDNGLKPFIKHLLREVTREDIEKLVEIRIKRISKFDIDKAKKHIESIEDKIKIVKYNLDNLIDYAIKYFKEIKDKFGKDRNRKTKIMAFENINAKRVIIANTKLYINKKDGFIGTTLKRDEFLFECSDLDNIITFNKNGKMMVTKVDKKTFIGKNNIHTSVFRAKDKRTTYNVIYRDGKMGACYMKRFNVSSVTKNREYDITKGAKGSEILYFSANKNGEAEVVEVILKSVKNIKKLKIDVDFADLAIKGRGVKGNLVTKHSVKKIDFKKEGVSTLSARKIWFDDTVNRMNNEARGELIGEFEADDKILIISQIGYAQLLDNKIATRLPDDIIKIEKWTEESAVSCVYYNDEKSDYYAKRFLVENTNKKQYFIPQDNKSFIEIVSTNKKPFIEIEFKKEKNKDRRPSQIIELEDFISVKGISSLGNKLTPYSVKEIIEKEAVVEQEVSQDILEEKDSQTKLEF